MTTKLTRTVEFYATSPRLARAYLGAAKHNKILARLAGMRELGNGQVVRDVVKSERDFEMVVLSHVDEGHVLLTDKRLERVVAGAFHLLFTEPATHPDQIAAWMRATNIRSENRLHVVKFDDLHAPQVSQLLGRVCSSFERDGTHGGIVDAYLAGDSFIVRGPKLRVLRVPAHSVRALRGQPPAVLRNFVIDPDGSFLHWPDLDVHLGWHQFLQAVDPEELRKAQQRSAGFNERYGAAIRKVREEAGIAQSKIEGLVERQVRRIEHGVSRATPHALAALAKAHGLDANAYAERLANFLK